MSTAATFVVITLGQHGEHPQVLYAGPELEAAMVEAKKRWKVDDMDLMTWRDGKMVRRVRIIDGPGLQGARVV